VTAPTGRPLDYRAAGVDLDAAVDAKERLRRLVDSTRTAGVLGAFGGFGGMFRVPAGRAPLLVSSADGVGTKVKLAVEAGRLDTVGHDLVNHCANDILVQGALPLFFLDYVAFGKLEPARSRRSSPAWRPAAARTGAPSSAARRRDARRVHAARLRPRRASSSGGWRRTPCSARRVRDGRRHRRLASSGLHTNGYSLARPHRRRPAAPRPTDAFPEHAAPSTADVLARGPPRLPRRLRPDSAGCTPSRHITGGGLPGNLDRSLPPELDAVVELGSWEPPALFRVLAEAGAVPPDEMSRTFNMGVGMCAVAAPADAGAVVAAAAAAGVPAWVMGHVEPGAGRVIFR
jgi:phosphoribosylformylglycinamidine cyclo-ligase